MSQRRVVIAQLRGPVWLGQVSLHEVCLHMDEFGVEFLSPRSSSGALASTPV